MTLDSPFPMALLGIAFMRESLKWSHSLSGTTPQIHGTLVLSLEIYMDLLPVPSRGAVTAAHAAPGPAGASPGTAEQCIARVMEATCNVKPPFPGSIEVLQASGFSFETVLLSMHSGSLMVVGSMRMSELPCWGEGGAGEVESFFQFLGGELLASAELADPVLILSNDVLGHTLGVCSQTEFLILFNMDRLSIFQILQCQFLFDETCSLYTVSLSLHFSLRSQEEPGCS